MWTPPPAHTIWQWYIANNLLAMSHCQIVGNVTLPTIKIVGNVTCPTMWNMLHCQHSCWQCNMANNCWQCPFANKLLTKGHCQQLNLCWQCPFANKLLAMWHVPHCWTCIIANNNGNGKSTKCPFEDVWFREIRCRSQFFIEFVPFRKEYAGIMPSWDRKIYFAIFVK